jgi:hypothetical protein
MFYEADFHQGAIQCLIFFILWTDLQSLQEPCASDKLYVNRELLFRNFVLRGLRIEERKFLGSRLCR